MRIKIPPVFSVDVRIKGNSIRQLLAPVTAIEGTAAKYTGARFSGTIILPAGGTPSEILVINRKVKVPSNFTYAIDAGAAFDSTTQEIDWSFGSWLKHPNMPVVSDRAAYAKLKEAALGSWHNAFHYLREDPERGVLGLRNPQIGALHMILGHWSASNDVATIVMPTGTGKTETMLSVLVAVECQRVLVVVPTDALRTQIAEKFATLGILKRAGVVSAEALYPVVGMMKRRPRSQGEIDELFESCNVVVTTSHIAGQCAADLQKRFAFHCPYLFIDEAHHVEASTWKSLKESFNGRRILQFTATPFREDDKVLEGRIIYKYPLRKAQEEGFFKHIHFKAVIEFNISKADEAIASAAVAALEADTTGKHVLMARAGSVNRAYEVFKFYEAYGRFNPVQLHTGITSSRLRDESRSKLISGNSRIVVCVDMLGEGFDLPELKIAAFHDIRKSLAVTLQIAGRFTRARQDLGDATFIANIADVEVQDELRKLYTQDPDWNALLPDLSEKVIGEQIEVRRFLDGFNEFPNDIPLRALRPAASTVIYRTKCAAWTPERFREGIPAIDSCVRIHHSINAVENVLVIVTARRAQIEWADLEDLYTWEWDLHVLIWDSDTNLLYINGSSNRGMYKELAEAVAGKGVELIKEPAVFRCFGRINRLRLTNVGLTEQLARLVSYTGRMGADVESALSAAHKRNTRKAVLFGTGFENGARTTIGASRRGRLWSFRRVRLNELGNWCKAVGAKLSDPTINPEEVLKGTLQSQLVTTRPSSMPIGIDWPEEFYREPESAFTFFIDEGKQWPLHETGIELVSPSLTGDILFKLSCGDEVAVFKLSLLQEEDSKDYRFSSTNGLKVSIGNPTSQVALEKFFYNYPPVIWFADGSSLEGNLFTPLRSQYGLYDRLKIIEGDWTGVDLKKESQGVEKETNSIQFRLIHSLLAKSEYKIVFDDDGSGEIADVITIKTASTESGGLIQVEMYHCKYSKDAAPGARVEDLYEVCGQAQKSVSWMYSQEKQVDLFSHMLKREPKRVGNQEATRFEKGDKHGLFQVREMSRNSEVRLTIFLVQPGLSKMKASNAQLELLAVTENYLLETYKIPFGIIGSS